MKDTHTSGTRNGKAWASLLMLTLLAGLGFRIFGAWCLQYATNSDYGIVGLMAKHMAEGTDYPVFFYGQPYMGSFEPAISALLCRIMGVSGFAVCLGTGLLAFGLLPILYLWARDARDRIAGLVAVVFSLVGSFAYFFYCAAPRGGYVSTLVFGAVTVWLAARIAMRAWTGGPVQGSRCLLLGLAAGVAWWSNQLVVPFLAAAALTLLIGLRGRIFRLALLLGGGIGFTAGSLPWWIWNVTHHWESLQFGGTLGQTPFMEGVGIFGRIFAELLEVQQKPVWVLALLALAYGFLLVGYGLELRARWRERRAAFLPLLSPVFVVLFMALVYSTSHFARMAEVRYILPAFPAVAIMVGIGTARWAQRTRLGWVPLLVLVVVQCCFLPNLVRYRTEQKKKWAAAAEIAGFLKAQSIDVAYGGYGYHWMNFATLEALCVTSLEGDRYAPYEKRAVAAARVAYFSDHLDMADFIAHSGGTAASASVAGHKLFYDVQPPTLDVTALPTQEIVTVTAGSGGPDVFARLHDLDLDTGYAVTLESNARASLEWTFVRSEPICGLQVFHPEGDYLWQAQVEGRESGSTTWKTLLPWTKSAFMFWSGPRICYQGAGCYLEYRFPEGHYDAVRLSVASGGRRTHPVHLGEVAWLQPGRGAPPSDPAIDEVVGALQARHIERLYAPQWMSEQVCQRTGGAIETSVSSFFARRISDGPGSLDKESKAVEVTTRKTALLVYRQDAVRTRACLARVGLGASEAILGPWVLFDCQPGITGMGHILPPLRWTERGCFLSLQLAAKNNADYWFRRMQTERQAGVDANRILEGLRRAVEFYPAYQPALAQLADDLLRSGQTNEALIYRQELLRQTQPSCLATVSFAAGAKLLGIDLPVQTVRRGASFPLTYYWQCAAEMKADEWSVFVHFVRGQAPSFQDDHVLLEEVPAAFLRYQPFPEIFRVSRVVQVPAGVAPGEYRVRMGLCNRLTQKRDRSGTDLPLDHKAVWLPVTLRVEE